MGCCMKQKGSLRYTVLCMIACSTGILQQLIAEAAGCTDAKKAAAFAAPGRRLSLIWALGKLSQRAEQLDPVDFIYLYGAASALQLSLAHSDPVCTVFRNAAFFLPEPVSFRRPGEAALFEARRRLWLICLRTGSLYRFASAASQGSHFPCSLWFYPFVPCLFFC